MNAPLNLPLKYWLARGVELTSTLRIHVGVLGALQGDDAVSVSVALMELIAQKPEALHGLMEAAVDKAERDEGFRELQADAYQPPPPDWDVLSEFGSGTLGRSAAMRRTLGRNSRRPIAVNLDDPFGFLVDRVRTALPAWRALLGREPGLAGDMALQGFLYGQTECPAAMFVAALSLYRTAAFRTSELPAAVQALNSGFDAGQRAVYLPGVRLEDDWATPLSDLRLRLRLPTTGI